VIGLPLLLAFGTDDGLPADLELILELFIAWVAGAVAGCLVPRYGWVFGVLTQVLRILLVILLFGIWAYLVATDAEMKLSLDPLRAPIIRLMLFAIVTAAIGGLIAERYRSQIFGFLTVVFGFVGAGLGCASYGFGFLVELYFVYLGGKAFFEEGAILKALLFIGVLGPLVSFVLSLLLMGLLMLGAWVFERLYRWYAPDLGLAPLSV